MRGRFAPSLGEQPASGTVRGRFAPSPSGRMHLGNALAYLLAWLSARSQNGEMVLRIEDLDTQRCRPEYAKQLADDLRWLGLDWDYGGVEPQYMQSRRSDIYAEYLQKIAKVVEIYPCRCTRAELHSASAPHATDGTPRYDGRCYDAWKRHSVSGDAPPNAATVPLNDGAPNNVAFAPLKDGTLTNSTSMSLISEPPSQAAMRIHVPDIDVEFTDLHYGTIRENLRRDCGDFILRRSDGAFAYQLAVVVDDALMGITEVVRGRDLLGSAARQKWLHGLIGSTPPQFAHTPLLVAADGRRLSKRDGDMAFGALRGRFSAEEIIGRLAAMAGLLERYRPVSAAELIPLFERKRITTDNIAFSGDLCYN